MRAYSYLSLGNRNDSEKKRAEILSSSGEHKDADKSNKTRFNNKDLYHLAASDQRPRARGHIEWIN